jgi:hypothetical protein
MKEFKDYTKWTLQHIWVIIVSYFSGTILLLLIHGLFGFTMKDDGTYLSNTLMHVASGSVLALGTGILQKVLLKKYFRVSFFWVLSLIIGFILAELLAGLVLWKLEIYRGLINIFNNSNHFPEASIFALAGLISGILQIRLLKPYYKKRFYWIVSSTLGWGLLILSTYFGLIAILLGPFLYGAITGLMFYWLPVSGNQIEKIA